jgi:hypothetical protein
MHAVLVDVTIKDRPSAQGELRDEVVPMVSGAPGFVAAYWVAVSDNQGRSIAVFESEEAANGVAERIGRQSRDAVTIDNVAIGEVVAHA